MIGNYQTSQVIDVGEWVYEETKDLNLSAVGGLGVESLPLIMSTLIAYHEHGHPMEGFWVRRQMKDHGTKKVLEGNVASDGKIAFISLEQFQ